MVSDSVFDLLSVDAHGRSIGLLVRSCGEGFEPKGVAVEQVRSSQELLELVERGSANRAVGKNNVHAHSSRSHAFLTLHVERVASSAMLATGGKSQMAKVHLIDLAGSESFDTNSPNAGINFGLLALGKVLASLADGRKHVPYRDSTLTKLLQVALGGSNALTIMLTCLNPSSAQVYETLSSLQYAKRAAGVVNRDREAELKAIQQQGDKDVMTSDSFDSNSTLHRRCEIIETTGHGELYARCAGDPADPLVLYVHDPRDVDADSSVWNELVLAIGEWSTAHRLTPQQEAEQDAAAEAAAAAAAAATLPAEDMTTAEAPAAMGAEGGLPVDITSATCPIAAAAANISPAPTGTECGGSDDSSGCGEQRPRKPKSARRPGLMLTSHEAPRRRAKSARPSARPAYKSPDLSARPTHMSPLETGPRAATAPSSPADASVEAEAVAASKPTTMAAAAGWMERLASDTATESGTTPPTSDAAGSASDASSDVSPTPLRPSLEDQFRTSLRGPSRRSPLSTDRGSAAAMSDGAADSVSDHSPAGQRSGRSSSFNDGKKANKARYRSP